MTKHKHKEEELPEEVAADTTVVEEQVETAEAAVENVEEDFAKKFEALNDSHLRLMAEFDNYRKRTMREKADLLKSAGESVLVNILPLVDDFERGLKATENATDVVAVREGMELIYGKFLAFLTQNGVKEILAAEQPFDTEFHEALTTIPAPTEELKGKVIDCVQKGYVLNEKVIRFSKVVVGE